MVRVAKRKPPNNQYGLIGLLVLVVAAAGLVATVVASLLGPAPSSSSETKVVQLAEFPHESMFRSTLHQCLPLEHGAKCKQYIAPGESSRQRIAFLAPPGDVSASILKVVQHIALLYNNQHSPKQPIEVIGSTHVPPYGYGKTHGYTKIIRLVPNPLMLDVADVLNSLDQDAIAEDTVRTVLRQVLRFHCRLSHVAAHTALLTLDVVEQSPQHIVQQLVSFIAGGGGDDDHHQSIQDQAMIQMNSFSSVLRQAHDRAAHLLARSTTTTNLDEVLMEELVFTKNMTVWPCPSFWSAADGNGVVTTSSTGQLLAHALSPNCSDPMASCFVKRDKCEAAGDALCKGK